MIWNQFVIPRPVLTVASWPAYRCLRRQVRWSGIPISFRIFQFVVIHTKGRDVCYYHNASMHAAESLQSCPTLMTLRTVALQAPLSVGFSRQEYWSGLPFPSPGNLPNPRIEPGSPALQAYSLPSEPPESPKPTQSSIQFLGSGSKYLHLRAFLFPLKKICWCTHCSVAITDSASVC